MTNRGVQDLLKEINNLKEYNTVLESENHTRDEERKALQREILRLTNFEKLVQSGGYTHPTTITKVCTDCSKYKSQISQLQNKVVRLQRQISTLESTNKNLKSFESEKYVLTTKVSSLQSEIRSLKSTLTIRDSEITNIRSQQSSQTKSVTSLEQQISTLKTTITNKETQITSLKYSLKTSETQANMYRQKHEQALKKVTQTTSTYSTSSSHYSEQISKLNSEISIKDKEIKELNILLGEVQERDKKKDREVENMDRVVNSYLEKIRFLEVELHRLESSHNQNIALSRLRESQDYALAEENNVLNQHIGDLERRIHILEEANESLRDELSLSIEARSQDSRLKYQREEQELLSTIRILKTELEDLRISNLKYKDENEHMQAKLSALELETNISNIYAREQLKPKEESHIREQQSLYPPSKDFSTSSPYVRTSKIDDAERDPRRYGPSSPNSSQLNGDSYSFHKSSSKKMRDVSADLSRSEYSDLQKKIERLRSENAGLRKHLYN